MSASAVISKRVQNQVRPLNTRPATVVGCAGVTEMGPVGVQQVVLSWDDYQTYFGGFTANAQDTPLQVKALFDEAGDQGNVELHVSRVVHTTTVGDPTTKTSAAASLALLTASIVAVSGAATSGNPGPWTLTPGQTLVVAVDGGGGVTKTFTATQAALTGSNAAPFAFTNGWSLSVTVNGVLYGTFTLASAMFTEGVGTALAPSVAAAFNAWFAANAVPAVATVGSGNHVVVTSNQAGSGSGVTLANVTGTPVTALGMATPATGTGDVANIAAVTLAEAESLVGAVSGCTTSADGSGHLVVTSATSGPSSSVQVTGTAVNFAFDGALHAGVASGTQPTLTAYGLWDGTYANTLSLEVSPPASGSATEFNLALLDSGVLVQAWSNLTLDPASPRYAPYVVNGPPTVNGIPGTNLSGQAPSTLVRVADADLYEAGVPLTLARPAGSVSPAGGTVFGPLTGGLDGLGGLVDTDWSGDVTANGRTGLRALDLVQDVALLICPGRATAGAHNAMVNFCEVVRGGLCYAVLDTPASLTAAEVVTYVQTTSLLAGTTEMASIYWPRVQVDNPDTTVFGQASTVVTGPSGSIAGLCCRLDAAKPGGAFTHPASQEKGYLQAVRGLEAVAGVVEVLDIVKRGLVFDALVNPVMVKTGVGAYVDGARTLKDTGPFPTVGESRGVLSVQVTVGNALDPKRNQNMNARFYNEIATTVSQYLSALTRAGCFASSTDADAWYFEMGPAINTAAVQAAREALAKMGLATSKPAEMIYVYISPFSPAPPA